jgi:hypothetical protein
MTRIEDEGRRPISALLPAGTDTAQAVLDAGARALDSPACR